MSCSTARRTACVTRHTFPHHARQLQAHRALRHLQERSRVAAGLHQFQPLVHDHSRRPKPSQNNAVRRTLQLQFAPVFHYRSWCGLRRGIRQKQARRDRHHHAGRAVAELREDLVFPVHHLEEIREFANRLRSAQQKESVGPQSVMERR
jgi:hypothetical protein